MCLQVCKCVSWRSFDSLLRFFLKMFLFLLPWQTIWIFRESFLNGVKMEWWTEGVYFTEVFLWLIISLFIAWYLCLFRSKFSIFNFQFSKDRIFIFSVLLFTVYCLLSYFWSLDGNLAIQHSLHILEAFLLFFVLWIGPLKKEEAIKWLVLGSILPCILGIWQFFTQSTFASAWLGLAWHPAWQGGTAVVASETIGRWLRAYGSFAHPNVFGGYLVIILLFYCLPGRSHKTAQTDSVVQNEERWLRLITYNLLLTTLFFTFSRSAWLAVAAVCIMYPVSCIPFSRKRNYNRLQVMGYMLQVVFVLVLFITFFPIVQTRFGGHSVSELYSINDRVSGYSEAWKLFKQHPILGVGAGNYTLYESQPAHNAAVLFAVETGVVGVGLLFVLVLCLCNLYPVSCNLFSRHRAGYMLRVMGFLILALLDHYLYSSYIGLMLSALFFALILRKSGENTVSPQLVHYQSFDTTCIACHNTQVKEPTVGAGA